MTEKNKLDIKSITKNRKALHKFFILEAFEAGLILLGHEVKSLREGRISIEESMVREEKGELFLFNVYIPPYRHLSHIDYQPSRSRKILMHHKEIERLISQVQIKGLTLIPLELYFKNGKAKVTVALAKGKKSEDQREEIKKRESQREIKNFKR